VQRHGVGRQLLTALIERSRKVKAEAVLLEVRVDNAPAIEMYRDFGFEILGVRKRYYQPEDVDAYTMRLDLAVPADAPVDAPVDAPGDAA
jgi:ribosomal-protein-alanine N-acetyltransferase